MRSGSKKLEEMVEELNDIIEQTYYFEQKVFEWSKKVESNKKYISKAMGKKEKIEVDADETTAFRATKYIKTNIDFFPEKLKETLNKENYDKVVEKTVTIKNLDGLIKMLKGYGVPPRDFKNFISVKSEVIAGNVDALIENEEIGIEDIQGCYKCEFEEEIKVVKTK